jgi:UDP-GlcNAc:undecaprenyl-phosphate/decaprenyl-phosphate GlcNAc-1-phosphate transferase
MLSFLAQIPSQHYSADEVAAPYIYVFYAAFIVAFCFTPVMQMVASYYGIIDEPDNKRKLHSAPVAYLGGVAVFLGWISGMAISQFLSLHRTEPGLLPHLKVPFSIIIGASVIVLLGLWDDIQHISPKVKIGGQMFAALCLLMEGVGIRSTGPMLVPVFSRLEHLLQINILAHPLFPYVVYITSALLVIGAIVGCCNATNLMDGLDGLCGGVTAIIAAGFLFLAIHLAMFGGGMNSNWDALRVVLGFALLGAILGFIPYNFNPASIFMGDTGSMFLGYSCGTLIILLAQERPKWFLAAMVIFALPVLDTVLAFARRYVAGRPIFQADRFHFHHQLLARGMSVRRAVIIIYIIAIGFALLGSAIVFMRTRYAVAIYLVIFGSIVVAAYKMGMVHERPRVVKAGGIDADEHVTPTEEIDPSGVLEIEDPRNRAQREAGGTAPVAGSSPNVEI